MPETSKITDELVAQILADQQRSRPFIKAYGTGVWSRLKKLVGREEALSMVDMSRTDILTNLRMEHGFTLQAVADVFGLSRERIRQLTPADLWHKSAEGIDWEQIALKVASLAVRNREAWGAKGRIRRAWVVERFGEDVADHVNNLQSKLNKLKLILRFRLGLEDDESCLKWLNDRYFGDKQTYAEIARRLSVYAPITTMCVYRNAVEMGFKGYSVGRRPDWEGAFND